MGLFTNQPDVGKHAATAISFNLVNDEFRGNGLVGNLNHTGTILWLSFKRGLSAIEDFIGTEEELGKPVGSDLDQGTLTLPAILLLKYYPEDNPVKRLFKNRDERDNIKVAIELLRDSPIIQECYQVASDYCAKGCRNLKLLPDNASRQSLLELAGFITYRKK